MDWKKLLYEQITLHDIYQWFEDSDIYKSLSTIGDEIYPATQYGNVFIIEKDPLSLSYMRVIQLGYYLGVASFMQLEHGLHLNRGSNLEYCTVITLRSMVELSGRVHKAVRMLKEKPQEEFVKQSKRLTMPFIPGGGGGFNVMTLVESLKDKIPDIMDNYNHMSEYLHGDLTLHAIYRKMTYLTGHLDIFDDSTEEDVIRQLKSFKGSPVISKYEKLIESLRTVLLQDLEFIKIIAAPFSAKYLQHLKQQEISDSNETDNTEE